MTEQDAEHQGLAVDRREGRSAQMNQRAGTEIERELPVLRETAPALAERGGVVGLTEGLDALLDRFTGTQG